MTVGSIARLLLYKHYSLSDVVIDYQKLTAGSRLYDSYVWYRFCKFDGKNSSILEFKCSC
jgi:hypothetical protein